MEISSSNVKYSDNFIDTVYDYQTTMVEKSNGKLLVSSEEYTSPRLLIHSTIDVEFFSNDS